MKIWRPTSAQPARAGSELSDIELSDIELIEVGMGCQLCQGI